MYRSGDSSPDSSQSERILSPATISTVSWLGPAASAASTRPSGLSKLRLQSRTGSTVRHRPWSSVTTGLGAASSRPSASLN